MGSKRGAGGRPVRLRCTLRDSEKYRTPMMNGQIEEELEETHFNEEITQHNSLPVKTQGHSPAQHFSAS